MEANVTPRLATSKPGSFIPSFTQTVNKMYWTSATFQTPPWAWVKLRGRVKDFKASGSINRWEVKGRVKKKEKRNMLAHSFQNKGPNIFHHKYVWIYRVLRVEKELEEGVLIFFNRLWFLEQFQVHSKSEQRIHSFSCFPVQPHPHTRAAYPIINIPPPQSTLVTTDEPTLTHHCTYFFNRQNSHITLIIKI